MILPDVNVLLYAFLRRSPDHQAYRRWLVDACQDVELALAETVLLGVLRIASNPRMTTNPAPAAAALRFVETLRRAPRARMLEPTFSTWNCLREILARDPAVRGNLLPDAWLAALAITHGARLATADRGFARFDGLDWFTPVAPGAAG